MKKICNFEKEIYNCKLEAESWEQREGLGMMVAM